MAVQPPSQDHRPATDGKAVIQSGEIGQRKSVWQAMGGLDGFETALAFGSKRHMLVK